MTILDYGLLAVIGILFVLALAAGRKSSHCSCGSGGCSGNCAGCGRKCESEKAPRRRRLFTDRNP